MKMNAMEFSSNLVEECRMWEKLEAEENHDMQSIHLTTPSIWQEKSLLDWVLISFSHRFLMSKQNMQNLINGR